MPFPYPTSTAYRVAAIVLPYWLLCGAAGATALHQRRGWPGVRWMLKLWCWGPITLLVWALDVALSRPVVRRR